MADISTPGVPPASVLRQLNQCNRELEQLLQNLRNQDHAERELRQIAREVIAAVRLQPDVALATIFLSQIAGTYAVRHCIETAVVAEVMARGMGKSDTEILTLTAASLTMNVGMLRHSDGFQHKSAPLTREEMAIVRRHPEESADLLKSAGIEDEDWISCVLLHHENDEGTGYPSGLASPQVTQNAKLISLADRYCAQVSARNYRRSVLPDRALRNLADDRHSPPDPVLLGEFARELGSYPPGCLVRLHNGETAVVSQRGAGGVLHLHSVRDASGAALSPAEQRSSEDQSCAIVQVLSEDEAAVRFSMKQIWGGLASL